VSIDDVERERERELVIIDQRGGRWESRIVHLQLHFTVAALALAAPSLVEVHSIM
jgi:hypothetical protein